MSKSVFIIEYKDFYVCLGTKGFTYCKDKDKATPFDTKYRATRTMNRLKLSGGLVLPFGDDPRIAASNIINDILSYHDLNQADFARIINVTHSHVNKIYNGKSDASRVFVTLLKLIKAFPQSIDVLRRLNDENNKK